jgi:hypothetical protein
MGDIGPYLVDNGADAPRSSWVPHRSSRCDGRPQTICRVRGDVLPHLVASSGQRVPLSLDDGVLTTGLAVTSVDLKDAHHQYLRLLDLDYSAASPRLGGPVGGALSLLTTYWTPGRRAM